MYTNKMGLLFTDFGEKNQYLGIKHGKNPSCYNQLSQSQPGEVQSIVFKNIPHWNQSA